MQLLSKKRSLISKMRSFIGQSEPAQEPQGEDISEASDGAKIGKFRKKGAGMTQVDWVKLAQETTESENVHQWEGESFEAPSGPAFDGERVAQLMVKGLISEGAESLTITVDSKGNYSLGFAYD